MLMSVRYLPPSDELDVLFAQELAESVAGEEVEVALTPGGAPGGAFARGGAHFGVVVAEVDDQFGDSWLEVAKSVLVEIAPFFWWDGWFDGDGVIDDHIVGERFFEIGKIGKPIASDEERQVVLMGNPQRDFEEFLASAIQTILMGIEMSGPNAHSVGAIDLRAEFDFGFDGIDSSFRRPVMMQVAIFVEQAGNFVGGSDRSPAVVNPLAGKCEMQAEIHIGMRFGVVSNFRKPRAGHHDAGGVDCAGFEGLNGGGVDRVSDAEIVGVDDEEFGVGRIAEAFGERVFVSLRGG